MVGIGLFNKTFYNKIKISFLFFVFLGLIIFSVSPIVRGNTIVSVNPSSQSVFVGDNFSVDIYCVPDKPIKAFEFKMLFNATLIEANSVAEGDIFNSYSTFFNSGIINNTEGSIINVFGLIIGQGNVTDPGNLVTISFSSKSDIGNSTLDLYDVGITNETSYISILTNDGNITIDYPNYTHIFSEETPTDNSIDVPISSSYLSVLINNTEGNQFYWEITSSPNIGSNSANNESNGSKICNISEISYSTTYTWFVKCKDLVSNEWTNQSYLFTTIDETTSPPGGGGGGGVIIQNNIIVPNNPPNKPLTPIGPIFIEKEVLYEFSSSSIDSNGDKIRYRFDWGDGTISDWSDLQLSNLNVSMLHSWDSISIYEIKVIAQDEHGLNSSWSDTFKVIVSQTNASGEEPVAEISILSDNLVSNQTIIFDASNSYDSDGVIINYYWEFGDGETGNGINISHVFRLPGNYIVTLTVIDNDGNTFSNNMTVNIADQTINTSIEKESIIPIINLEITSLVAIVVIIVVILVVISIIFRDKIGLRLLNHKIGKFTKVQKNKK